MRSYIRKLSTLLIFTSICNWNSVSHQMEIPQLSVNTRENITKLEETLETKKIRLALKRAAEHELNSRGTSSLLWIKIAVLLASRIIIQWVLSCVSSKDKPIFLSGFFGSFFTNFYYVNGIITSILLIIQFFDNVINKNLNRIHTSYRNTMTNNALYELVERLKTEIKEEDLNKLLLRFIDTTNLKDYNALNCDAVKRSFSWKIAEQTRNNFTNVENNNTKIMEAVINNYEWTAKDFFIPWNFVQLFSTFIYINFPIKLVRDFVVFILKDITVSLIQHSYYKNFMQDMQKIKDESESTTNIKEQNLSIHNH